MGAGLLLDTHAAIWLLEGSPKLGTGARAALDDAETIALAGISLLEISMLAARGAITLKPDPETALKEFTDRLTILPIDARVALDAVRVPLPQRDPFDRVITATARVHGLALVTKDQAITDAKVVTVIW